MTRAVYFPFAMILVLCASTSRAEFATWDPGRVVAAAKDLEGAADALEETFLKQPVPYDGSVRNEPYYRLRQIVRMLRREAHELVHLLRSGERREQTGWTYETLMLLARSARYEASRAVVFRDVGERAAAVRVVLNQLGPFYDPDFVTLAPDPNIETGATR